MESVTSIPGKSVKCASDQFSTADMWVGSHSQWRSMQSHACNTEISQSYINMWWLYYSKFNYEYHVTAYRPITTPHLNHTIIQHSTGKHNVETIDNSFRLVVDLLWILGFCCTTICLQCFDAVGWTAGRTSSLWVCTVRKDRAGALLYLRQQWHCILFTAFFVSLFYR